MLADAGAPAVLEPAPLALMLADVFTKEQIKFHHFSCPAVLADTPEAIMSAWRRGPRSP